MAEKLILPTEVRICATCGYWDGERRVDGDMRLVVIEEACQGECLVKEQIRPGLHDARQTPGCLWEHLAPEPEGDGGAPDLPPA